MDKPIKMAEIQTIYRDVSIPCDHTARHRLDKEAGLHSPNGYGYAGSGYEFQCRDCKAVWNRHDFSGADEPEGVTCSSCYGKRVTIIRMRIQFYSLEPRNAR